jgi:hypothetical protein
MTTVVISVCTNCAIPGLMGLGSLPLPAVCGLYSISYYSYLDPSRVIVIANQSEHKLIAFQ